MARRKQTPTLVDIQCETPSGWRDFRRIAAGGVAPYEMYGRDDPANRAWRLPDTIDRMPARFHQLLQATGCVAVPVEPLRDNPTSTWNKYSFSGGWGTLSEARVKRIGQFIYRSGPYAGMRGFPSPHEIAKEFDLDLHTARRLDHAHIEATGPGGRGEEWFIKRATQILKEAP